MANTTKDAIDAALKNDWQKAISINISLLKENKEDINSLSRLAHANIQIGKIDEAIKLYKKILTFDKYNNIAIKNLDKLSSLSKSAKKSRIHKSSIAGASPSLFIEEPGKTKTVNLINPAPINILSQICTASEVFLHPKKHSIDVRTENNIYLGALPDDFAYKLLRFINAGYEYKVYIKSATKNNICVFIQETKRAKRYKSQPSFINASILKNTLVDHKFKDDEETEESAEKDSQEDLDV